MGQMRLLTEGTGGDLSIPFNELMPIPAGTHALGNRRMIHFLLPQ